MARASSAGQVAVTATSTLIKAQSVGMRKLLIVNHQTVAVYLNIGAAATTSKFRLDPEASVVLSLAGALYGITANAHTPAGDAKVHYIETF